MGKPGGGSESLNPRGCDVVRRVGVKEGGEVLELPAARAELELAAAVDGDPVRLAVVVGVEEVLERSEARRLEVECARREREALDVHDRMDRCVPRDPVPVRLQHGPRLVRQGRVLEPRLREGDRDAAVEQRVGVLVDRRAFVRALEVDRVDGLGRDELRDELFVPAARRVELEADPRVAGAQALHGLRRCGLAEAKRDDVAHGGRRAPERLRERRACLSEREVERRALVRPAAVVGEGGHRRAGGEEVEPVEELGEALERVAAGERELAPRLERRLVARVVRHVLSHALVPLPTEVDHGRAPGELARDRPLEAFQLVGIELERQVGEPVVRRHRDLNATSSPGVRVSVEG